MYYMDFPRFRRRKGTSDAWTSQTRKKGSSPNRMAIDDSSGVKEIPDSIPMESRPGWGIFSRIPVEVFRSVAAQGTINRSAACEAKRPENVILGSLEISRWTASHM